MSSQKIIPNNDQVSDQQPYSYNSEAPDENTYRENRDNLYLQFNPDSYDPSYISEESVASDNYKMSPKANVSAEEEEEKQESEKGREKIISPLELES